MSVWKWQGRLKGGVGEGRRSYLTLLVQPWGKKGSFLRAVILVVSGLFLWSLLLGLSDKKDSLHFLPINKNVWQVLLMIRQIQLIRTLWAVTPQNQVSNCVDPILFWKVSQERTNGWSFRDENTEKRYWESTVHNYWAFLHTFLEIIPLLWTVKAHGTAAGDSVFIQPWQNWSILTACCIGGTWGLDSSDGLWQSTWDNKILQRCRSMWADEFPVSGATPALGSLLCEQDSMQILHHLWHVMSFWSPNEIFLKPSDDQPIPNK